MKVLFKVVLNNSQVYMCDTIFTNVYEMILFNGRKLVLRIPTHEYYYYSCEVVRDEQ